MIRLLIKLNNNGTFLVSHYDVTLGKVITLAIEDTSLLSPI